MAEAELALDQLTDRRCGECQVCCHVMAVRELKKPYLTRCAHQCEAGCGTYPTRPDSCREFSCAWRAGFGPEYLRPDRAGFLVTLEAPDGADGKLYVDVVELAPNVLNDETTFAGVVEVVRATLPLAGDQLDGVRIYAHGQKQLCRWDPDFVPGTKPTFYPIGEMLPGVKVWGYVGHRPEEARE